MPDDEKRPGDRREDAARTSHPPHAEGAREETPAQRIESDMRANRGLGLALRREAGEDAKKQSRTEEVAERAANNDDR